MEFFCEVENSGFDGDSLKKLLTIGRLSELCSSISSVIEDEKEKGVIYCVWGECEVNREELEFGIRFSMPDCPNALAWSITTDEGSNKTVIHCTINKKQHDEDFIETIRGFVSDWSDGLRKALNDRASVGL